MVAITLISNKVPPPSGFGRPLEIPCKYGDKLDMVINNLNKYRSPDAQIKVLYNQYGQQIPFNITIKENLTFYIDKGT